MIRLVGGRWRTRRPTWECAFVWIGILGLFLALLGGCGGEGGKSPSATSPPNSEARDAFEQGKKLINSDKPGAIAAFTRAIQAAPQYQQIYVWRGVAYQELGQREKALADFTKAIDLDPTDNYALEQRAKLYRLMGDSTKAQADEDRAAQLREKNRSQIRKNIEDAKKRKKRP